MRRALFVPLIAVFGLLAAGCVMPPPPDPGPELCAPGTFSATGEAPCTPAPVGTFVDVEGATEATPCPVGTFQDLEGQVSCNDAAPGTFVDFEGAASATFCPEGRFQPNSGATSCLIAPIGTYVDSIGAIAATDCPPGTTTDFAGATSVDDCVEPATLAVAYSNLDAVDGYDDSGIDVLIAELVDTNGDGVASVGDTLALNQYPLAFAATTFGSFGVTSTTVTEISGASSVAIAGLTSPTTYFSFGAGVKDLFWDRNTTTAEQVFYQDWASGTTTNPDLVEANPAAPSQPAMAAPRTTRTQTSDDPFIDVDIFV